MKRLTIMMLMLLAMPIISGCPLLRWLGFPVGDKVPYNPKESQGDTTVRENLQFADIPVPLGFVLRRNQTSSFRGPSFRFGKFVYEGAWTMRWTADFYRKQMPISQWQHVRTDEKSLYEETQYYKKGDETCEVLIKSQVDGMYVQVTVNEKGKDLARASSATGK